MSELPGLKNYDLDSALLRLASYLSHPQKFMAVADARSELRRTLKMAESGSVVLTNHGEPEAAVVTFATLQDMRQALMQLLLAEIEVSFGRVRSKLRETQSLALATTDDELEQLVGDAIRSHEGRGIPRPRRK
jgi:antitoxin (DNA-binding transcriptional repressor) of toxin-antitoxin stability system